MHLFFSDPDLNITKILYGQSGIFDQFGVRINLVKPKLIIINDKLFFSIIWQINNFMLCFKLFQYYL